MDLMIGLGLIAYITIGSVVGFNAAVENRLGLKEFVTGLLITLPFVGGVIAGSIYKFIVKG